MAIAAGTRAASCRHGATGPLCGLCVGERTRAAARAAGVPVSYWIRTQELGWHWAVRAGATHAIHLVPPRGERARCGVIVSLDGREQVLLGVAAGACARCWKSALGDTPRRSRA